MNKKKISLVILSIIIAIIAIVIPNSVSASAPSTPLYFGISLIRTNSATNVYSGTDAGKDIGYAIGDPTANGSATELRKGAVVWNIMKYPNATDGATGEEGNYYCIREGAGFTGTTTINTTSVLKKQYTNSFDMTEANKTAISNNITLLKDITNENYKGILALADLLYLGDAEDESGRIQFLSDAGINTALDGDDQEYSVLLSYSDIKVVQQAAIWYFSNKDGQTITNQWDTLYNNVNKSWLNYTIDGSSYNSLSSYDFGVNDNGEQVGSGKDREDQANILFNYLIRAASKKVTDGTISSNTKVTVYTDLLDPDNTQPIIYIERVPEIKEFDLSLRKYITQVDGNTLTGTDSRVPSIDESTLELGTTATYKHKKDAVEVKTGSTVIYKLTIYNESDKEGRATKIVDQLPTGLKFLEVVSGNFELDTYDYDGDNTLNLKRKSHNTTNLKAYETGKMDSETIEIKCEVTQNPGTTDKILTNVAWISEEIDEDGIVITDQTLKDRDSEPSTKPSVNKDNMEGYNGNGNKSDLTDSNYYYKGQQDDDDFEKLIIKKAEGKYNVQLIKEDKDGVQLNSTATFEVNGVTQQVTGNLVIAKDVEITAENLATPDKYLIKETKAPDKYCQFDGIIEVTVTKKYEDGKYEVDKVSYIVKDEDGIDITSQTGDAVKVELKNGNIYVNVKNYQFDLKLVKRIVEVNGTKVPERIESVDITNLANGTATTATYNLDKNPVSVKKGDIVKYTLRVYNEGDIDGYASEISEDIPDGLEFLWSEKTDNELEQDTTLTELEKEAIKYNRDTLWLVEEQNKDTGKVELIKTDYLALYRKDSNGKPITAVEHTENLIKAFDSTKKYVDKVNDKNPDYKEVSVYMKVTSDDSTGKIIRNEAAITDDSDGKGKPIDDRDSKPEDWVKYEDDEDYDNIILQSFDLALRKFIIAVSADTTIEDIEYLKNSDGTYTRAPIVDTSKLNTLDSNGNLITTAIYNHTKEPVQVNKEDIVIYMLRVYNEGDLDGYASEIKDHLPSYLEYVDGDFNKMYGWKVSDDGRTVTTTYLSNHIIEKTNKKDDGTIVLAYKEVPIMCKVKGTAKTSEKITNIADITVYQDENKKPVTDRDSIKDNVILPSDDKLPSYKDEITGDYIPGQEDDDDFEKVIIKRFDLALRKFITRVDEEEVTTRIPQVIYDEENNKITYEHTKEPVEVVTDNIVIYTIRVFNEGEVNGFASKVSDDIPDGLEYLPDAELNKEYRWVMYDSEGKETDDVSKAVKITTDYLSKEQGEARMKAESGLKENPALLTAFDGNKEISDTNPDYADVQVAFKVVEPNGSDRIIINSAQISDDTDENGKEVDDDDSTPDEWIEGEDDQDKEYIKLTEFDLALRKWVTQAIVIENGKETVTQTGHKPEDDPEDVVKVELNRKKLNSVTVKFKYSIRVTNEGDIAGYAKEITDYVPEGLKFVAADNSDWKDEGNNVISTRKLENTLLQPGESADVEVTLTWINGKNNLGLKTNIAEISEDYNEKNIPDRDSTPDNKVPGEDDIDDAPVILSITTGQVRIYFTLGFAILITIAGGIILIKKFVL